MAKITHKEFVVYSSLLVYVMILRQTGKWTYKPLLEKYSEDQRHQMTNRSDQTWSLCTSLAHDHFPFQVEAGYKQENKVTFNFKVLVRFPRFAELPPNSIMKGISWKADGRPNGRGTNRMWTLQFNYSLYKSLPMEPVFSQFNYLSVTGRGSTLDGRYFLSFILLQRRASAVAEL